MNETRRTTIVDTRWTQETDGEGNEKKRGRSTSAGDQD